MTSFRTRGSAFSTGRAPTASSPPSARKSAPDRPPPGTTPPAACPSTGDVAGRRTRHDLRSGVADQSALDDGAGRRARRHAATRRRRPHRRSSGLVVGAGSRARDGPRPARALQRPACLSPILRTDRRPPRVRGGDLRASRSSTSPARQSIYSDLGFMLLGFIARRRRRRAARSSSSIAGGTPPGFARSARAFGSTRTRCRAWRSPKTTRGAAACCSGEVHDENAFALGGVAGHAGLFGTAAAVGRCGALVDAAPARIATTRRPESPRRSRAHSCSARRSPAARARWDGTPCSPTSSCGSQVLARGDRPHRLHRHVAVDRSGGESLRRAPDQPRPPDARRRRHPGRQASLSRRRDAGSRRTVDAMILTTLDWITHRGVLRRVGGDRAVVLGARRAQRQRILSHRPQPAVVAGRHVDGGDDVRRRHAARGRRSRRPERHRRQLDLVERRVRQHADGVLLRAPVAPRRHSHRRRVRRAPLRGPAGGDSARLPRDLPGPADQLRRHGLGQSRDGEDPGRSRSAGIA